MTAPTDLFAATAYIERGIAYLRHNAFELAIADFDRAIVLAPDDPYAHWNKATALLSLGDYERGFVEHEWAWRLFSWSGFGPVKNDIHRLQALPMWDGESGKRLLVYHELGYGDAIMCFRYLPVLKQRSAALVLVIDECLARVARQFGVDVVARVPDDLTAFDNRLPLFSVMLALRETTSTIPRAPYVNADWQRVNGTIGLCWSGRTQKMFTGDDFINRLGIPRRDLHALQPGGTPHGVVPLRSLDFFDTARVIERMDHVVTVDTAIAHLAGAMGHPSTHLILPFMGDWRWWSTAAWYPTLKTYRQPQAGDDWAAPFAQINEALTSSASSACQPARR